MTENALTPQQNFEEKIKARMRENIGDLMPDQILAEMVRKAMKEMFFTRREKKDSGYYSRIEVLPSWFEDEVVNELKDKVLTEVKTAVDEKRDEIKKAAIELITTNLGTMVAKTICDVITGVPQTISMNIQQEIYNNLRSKGLNV